MKPSSLPHPALLGTLAFVVGLGGCSDIEKATPRPRAANSGASQILDVPDIMRGTVASQALLVGYGDVLGNSNTIVHGYGLVVGLRGTGHRTMPNAVRAHMIGEMARLGVGSIASGFNMSPEQLLDSLDTAVVVVRAVAPRGAPKETIFDVGVYKLPGTETLSLEGGTLWTAPLRPALSPGLPPTGSRQASSIAVARGPIFTNPFVAPGGGIGDGDAPAPMVTYDRGLILGGGAMSKSSPLKLRLATPSHNLASIIQQIINSQFPQEPGQRSATARGEDDQSIEITVPPSYHDRVHEFVHLLQHTTLDLAAVPLMAAYVGETLKRNPRDSEHAAWRWQSMGRQILPEVRKFYEYPEELPRYAALRAGARLNDPSVIEHLIELANTSVSTEVRTGAIGLLGEMGTDPKLIRGLRELLDDSTMDVRIASYEALSNHRTSFVRSYLIDGRYFMDYVECDDPLIYITLRDSPRIVVFGRDLDIQTPMFVSTWSSRLMLRADDASAGLHVRYRDQFGRLMDYPNVSPDLRDFVAFLGHTPGIESPAPGLGLTYGETIGVLMALKGENYLPGGLFTEQDRIMAAILDQESQPTPYEERPEFENLSIPSDEPPGTGSGFSPLNLPTDTNDNGPSTTGVGN